MEYNYKEIGKRLAECRKAAGYKSQADFMDALRNLGVPVGRNVLSALETGKPEAYHNMSLALLHGICALLHCDPAYLLGIHPERYADAHYICQETGLSEPALENIRRIIQWQNHESAAFSAFLESPLVWDFVSGLSTCFCYHASISDLRDSLDVSISDNPETETYRKNMIETILAQENKRQEGYVAYQLERICSQLADYMIQQGKENTKNGPKE